MAVIAGTYDHGTLLTAGAHAVIGKNIDRSYCRSDCMHTFAPSMLTNTNQLILIIMKALIVILACIALALAIKVVDLLTGRRINSVGAKSNKLSSDMPKIDITNEAELKEALKYYKDLAD